VGDEHLWPANLRRFRVDFRAHPSTLCPESDTLIQGKQSANAASTLLPRCRRPAAIPSERRFGVNLNRPVPSARRIGVRICRRRAAAPCTGCDAANRGYRLERCGSRSHAPSTLILRTLNLRAPLGGKNKRKRHPDSAQLSVPALPPTMADTLYMGGLPTTTARAFRDDAHPESALRVG
jgi:hypothetical protein